MQPIHLSCSQTFHKKSIFPSHLIKKHIVQVTSNIRSHKEKFQDCHPPSQSNYNTTENINTEVTEQSFFKNFNVELSNIDTLLTDFHNLISQSIQQILSQLYNKLEL